MPAAMADGNPVQLVLQALMCAGFMTKKQLSDCIRDVFERHARDDDADMAVPAVADVVGQLNSKLKRLGMQISSVPREDTGEQVLGLMNQSDDKLSELATPYKKEGIVLFKKLLEHIVYSEDGVISSMEAVSLLKDTDFHAVTLDRAEQLCQSFVKDGWLARVSESNKQTKGFFTLGPRAMLDLQAHISSMLGDEQDSSCGICRAICIYGQTCDCGSRFHVRCLRRLFDSTKKRECKECRQAWPRRIPGDEAHRYRTNMVRGDEGSVEDEEAEETQAPASHVSRSSAAAAADEDEMDAQPSAARSSRRRSAQTSQRGRGVYDEDDEDDDEEEDDDEPQSRGRGRKRKGRHV